MPNEIPAIQNKTTPRREQARRLKMDGLSYSQVGNALGITRQGAQKLIAPPRSTLKAMAQQVDNRCQMCGRKCRVLTGHHEDYAEEPSLMVCFSCHAKLENMKKNAGQHMLPNLSPRETILYEAIVAFKLQHDGCSPTLRELGASCDISSTSVINFYLKNMQKAGYIKVGRGARSIEVRGGRWVLS